MELVTAYEDAYTRSRRIVKSAVTETSIVKGSLKATTRYLPCGRYDKYDENEGADREKVKTEKSKLKTGNTSGAIPVRTIRTPQSCNKLQSSCFQRALAALVVKTQVNLVLTRLHKPSERGALNTHILP